MFLAVAAGIESCSQDRECDHDAEMDELRYPLEERINPDPNIEEDNLDPAEPEDGKETNVGQDCY